MRSSLLGRANFSLDINPGFGASLTNRYWQQAPLAHVWKPLEVMGTVESYQDFPGMNFDPAFSRRACDELRDILEPNGELLPLVSDAGEYYFYNITKVVDALDLSRSVFRVGFDPPSTDAGVEYFAFQEEKLEGLSIFRVLECPTLTIVTDQFVQRVHTAGLNGFEFAKIWPFSTEINWREEAQKRAKWKVKKTKALKQNVLVLMLHLAGLEPTPVEKRKIARLEKELDAQLLVPSLNAPFFGSYEESETVNKEFRIFITCPDVDQLTKKLLPWLRTLNWDGEAQAMKRYGELYDVEARELIFDLNSLHPPGD